MVSQGGAAWKVLTYAVKVCGLATMGKPVSLKPNSAKPAAPEVPVLCPDPPANNVTVKNKVPKKKIIFFIKTPKNKIILSATRMNGYKVSVLTLNGTYHNPLGKVFLDERIKAHNGQGSHNDHAVFHNIRRPLVFGV